MEIRRSVMARPSLSFSSISDHTTIQCRFRFARRGKATRAGAKMRWRVSPFQSAPHEAREAQAFPPAPSDEQVLLHSLAAAAVVCRRLRRSETDRDYTSAESTLSGIILQPAIPYIPS